MAVSVIISNMNGMKFLPRLLQSLREQRGVTVQVILVDRLSRDGSLDYLAGQPDVELVHEPPETGLVSGYATGVANARHDHLFFCNEDMWFDRDCLRLLEERINVQAGIVAADPWQWTYDGKKLIHSGTGFYNAIWNPLCPLPVRRYLFTKQLNAGEHTPFPCAGAFMIHRQAYDLAGGWDRSFFLDHEDVDLFIRIWQMGKICVTVPSAMVYHAVGASNQQHIPALNTPVQRRRYISGNASVSLIGIKYFTGFWTIYAYLYPLLSIFKELIRMRFNRVWLAILSATEVIQRHGEARKFRCKWKKWIKNKPGQFFFLDPRFAINPIKIS